MAVSKLVQQSLRILGGRFSVSIFTLLFTVYFAYELDKSTFALIALYTSMSTLMQVLTDLGLSFKVVREGPALMADGRHEEMVRTIIHPTLFVRLVAALGFAVLFGALLFFFKQNLEAQFPSLNISFIIVTAVLAMIFENLSFMTIAFFQIERRFGLNSVLGSTAQLLENIFAATLYVYAGINYYFLGVMLAQGGVAIGRFYVMRKYTMTLTSKNIQSRAIRAMLIFYFPMYLRRFLRFGLLHGEQLIVAALLPLQQLANFNIAKRLSKFMKMYLEAFSDPLTVKLVRSKNLSGRGEHVRTFLRFTVPLPLICAALSPWIMKYAGGPKYADYWPILAILYLSYAVSAFSIVQFNVVSLFGKPNEALMRDFIGTSVGLVSTFVLIFIFGEYGLAWGQLIMYVVLYWAGHNIARRYLKNLPADPVPDAPTSNQPTQPVINSTP